MFEFCVNQVSRVIYRIEDLCETEQYRIAFFGSDLDSCFLSNFEYSKFSDEYSIYNFIPDTSFDMILIAGNINYKQLAVIKNLIKEQDIKYSIYIPGSSLKRKNKFLYNIVSNIEEEIKFDLRFQQYPISLIDLSTEIRKLKRKSHE
jgi:hypothetical protein